MIEVDEPSITVYLKELRRQNQGNLTVLEVVHASHHRQQ